MAWFDDHFINTFFFVIFMFVATAALTALIARTPKKKKR